MNLPAITDVAALIDHTLLKADATRRDVLRICDEAREARFASVCVNPYWVRACASSLAGSGVKVCTVIGFPLGANRKGTKTGEVRTAMEEGAHELDVVLNVGALRSGEVGEVGHEIRELADVAHETGASLKVILETCLLTDEQKEQACRLSLEAGADFVKTSTGFSNGGATVADVLLMRRCVGDRMGVKASGGVRTLAAVREMIAAGATRIGTSSGLAILAELNGASGNAAQGGQY